MLRGGGDARLDFSFLAFDIAVRRASDDESESSMSGDRLVAWFESGTKSTEACVNDEKTATSDPLVHQQLDGSLAHMVDA